MGELFALPPTASYYFEPLHYAKYKMHANTSEGIVAFMTKLMTCEQQTMDAMRNSPMWMIRKFGTLWSNFGDAKYTSSQVLTMCHNATIHVAKTIRLRMADAAKLLQAATIPNLHIIHLVRDPRARFNSARASDGHWSNTERSLKVVCGDMENDLRVAETLGSSTNYTLLKYEDIATNVYPKIENIYKWLYGLQEVPQVAKFYISRHTNAEQDQRFNKTARNYYSTFRFSNFTLDHWKQDLSPDIIQTIQEHPSCNYVLKHLNYQFLPKDSSSGISAGISA